MPTLRPSSASPPGPRAWTQYGARGLAAATSSPSTTAASRYPCRLRAQTWSPATTGPWKPLLPRATSRSSLRPRCHPGAERRQSLARRPVHWRGHPRPRVFSLFGSASDLRSGLQMKGDSVLARQRQEAILREVDRTGGVRVSELVDTLGVSDMTVRRDIEVLATSGLVLKVHGGAAAVVGRSADEPGFRV